MAEVFKEKKQSGLKCFGIKLDAVPALIVRAADEEAAWKRYKREMGIIKTSEDYIAVEIPDPDPDGPWQVLLAVHNTDGSFTPRPAALPPKEPVPNHFPYDVPTPATAGK